ncbi:[Hydroxymethylglutaryl-CoA reductase (NADPH)] kinase [Handroanthus impetiginosus]|uniref:[Hydroxymethylglutaryl-CoA reductase (NADPH)] kinase n=1 Tax=Handroanthus impetiginosus TaxID=429701 RepID=A0A2G9GVG4_9LAMI|nr:[Hydroxymethylglutaryl-CoA reductase (NADPH)] kinase [Handroanthus impetiginosus]
MKSMRAVKDRVYDKLSRLFSDSQSSHVTLDQESEFSSCIVWIFFVGGLQYHVAYDVQGTMRDHRLGCLSVHPLPHVHYYKFFVDGEWRHNEHQPFVSGNFGVANTIFLPGEPDTIPAIFSSETAARSNMEVDNDPFLAEAASSASQAEIDFSRNRVSAFLSSHTAYELLPESGKVIALDINLPGDCLC